PRKVEPRLVLLDRPADVEVDVVVTQHFVAALAEAVAALRRRLRVDLAQVRPLERVVVAIDVKVAAEPVATGLAEEVRLHAWRGRFGALARNAEKDLFK